MPDEIRERPRSAPLWQRTVKLRKRVTARVKDPQPVTKAFRDDLYEIERTPRQLVRVEVRVQRDDTALIRRVAKALADPARHAEARALLRKHFAARPQKDLKALLAAAPLDGVDLTRPHDHARAIADLIGSVGGLPPDLSARKKHYLKATGYGRKRHR